MSGSAHRRAARETITVRGREARPVDGLAARVTRPGEEFNPAKNPNGPTWTVAPQTFEPLHTARANPEFIDLRGTTRGRMRIVGYLGPKAGFPSNDRGAAWLARCDCGTFEARRTATWRKGLAKGLPDMCWRCSWTETIRRREEEHRQGKNPGYHSHGARVQGRRL